MWSNLSSGLHSVFKRAETHIIQALDEVEQKEQINFTQAAPVVPKQVVDENKLSLSYTPQSNPYSSQHTSN